MKKRQKPTIHVVGAAIVKDSRCLVVQRGSKMSNPLEWEFPGGKVETAEDPLKALTREIREELDIEITVRELLGTSSSHLPAKILELTVYFATLKSGEINLTEHLRYGWFTVHEIDSLAWSLADRPLLGPLKRSLENNLSRERSLSTLRPLP
jgi:8-oxo-dGTP diphosphatase